MDPRQVVKDFVSRWSDEQLAHVAAFNEDLKMDAAKSCCCLVGVHSSHQLHTDLKTCPDALHYLSAKQRNDSVRDAEFAYFRLVEWRDKDRPAGNQPLRNRIFGEILSEVMAERESSRHIEEMSDPQVDRLFADIQAVQA